MKVQHEDRDIIQLNNIIRKGDGSVFWLSLFVIVVVWLLVGLLLSSTQKEENLVSALESGGSLFTALAFVAAGYVVILQRKSIDLQRKDLELQREELKETREELKGQKEQMELQNATMKRQGFENTFFKMVSLYGEIVSMTKHRVDKNIEYTGRDVYKYINSLLKDGMIKSFDNQGNAPEPKTVYWNVYSKYENILGHYFRFCYRVVKYVNETDLDVADKKGYVSILRSQISQAELDLIFYNCLFGHGVSKFKPLIEQYSFLEQLNKNAPNRKFLDQYKWSAFGREFENDLSTPPPQTPLPPDTPAL